MSSVLLVSLFDYLLDSDFGVQVPVSYLDCCYTPPASFTAEFPNTHRTSLVLNLGRFNFLFNKKIFRNAILNPVDSSRFNPLFVCAR